MKKPNVRNTNAQGHATCEERTRTRICLPRSPVQVLSSSPQRPGCRHPVKQQREHLSAYRVTPCPPPRGLPECSSPQNQCHGFSLSLKTISVGQMGTRDSSSSEDFSWLDFAKLAKLLRRSFFFNLGSSLTRGLKQAAFKKVSRMI